MPHSRVGESQGSGGPLSDEGSGSAIIQVSRAGVWGRLGVSVVAGSVVTEMGPTWDPDVRVHSPGVETEQIAPRVASFLFHTIEKRFWAYSEWEHKWPGVFAGICSPVPDAAKSACDRSRDMWEISCLAETTANTAPGLFTLRQKVYWMGWPINQLHFRMLAHCGFQAPPIHPQHEFIRCWWPRGNASGTATLREFNSPWVRGPGRRGSVRAGVAGPLKGTHHHR